MKFLCTKGQEFVIGGYEQESGRRFIGVVVGVYGPKGLTYRGTLERGFSAAPDQGKRPAALGSGTNPFAGPPPRTHVRWVRPELVARAEFREWTASGKISHASFRGLRDDKPASEVVREIAEAPLPLDPNGAAGRVKLNN